MTPGQWAQWVLWLPCGIAFFVAATVGIKNCGRLTNAMGLAKWDFNQSWASNITIVSGAVSFGILTTLLTDPTTWVLDKRAYTYLALFFPALVTLAPVVFNFTREVKVEVTNNNQTQVKIQGRAFTFLFAAALTVWGAAGQVEIQAGLVMSLLQQTKIELEPTVALEVLFVVVFGALPFYAWLTMNAAMRIQPDIAPRQSFRAAIDEARDSGWPLL
jgi:hypothetical protein